MTEKYTLYGYHRCAFVRYICKSFRLSRHLRFVHMSEAVDKSKSESCISNIFVEVLSCQSMNAINLISIHTLFVEFVCSYLSQECSVASTAEKKIGNALKNFKNPHIRKLLKIGNVL